ncbi:RNA-binding protein 25 [Myxocyprinus asiaticus]|uniref:RNA-binding protein 25 n=1 Tax=Myxocyprinus asiaticus TaxID=70543 RepID=UPI0022233D20|nr:RNA-binding protein 25 [Myxocyprinus asiaticus]
MSFPPHLNPIPQLPPGISATQFAGFPTNVPTASPIISMHMGMMPPSPAVLVPTTVQLVQKPLGLTREAIATHTKELEEGTGANTGPTTTVFVGDISEKASDMLVRQLLAKCGLVLSWKRVQGASGKLQAFGFCEYKEPESTLRALRLLHELQVGDKKLLVKVDAKTKAQLDTWKANQKRPNGAPQFREDATAEEVLDDETKRRDQMVKGAIDGLIREYSSELTASSQDADAHQRKKRREKKENDINAMEMEDDKRDLISREISKFRDTHKKLEEEKDRERQQVEKDRGDRDKERERERERRDRERDKERERERQKEREKERERERDRDRERTKEKEKEREKERSRDQSIDRSRSRERSREEKKREREEDEEETYERRKLERKLREKEAAYQERLKNWEIRERKKSRDYIKDEERDEERCREMSKEAKRLKEFLEDYDDDRDDPKYYRGSALQKRLRDREKELEFDERDRKREKDELEEIRQRLLAEGHPDPDAELQRMQQEAERECQPPLKQEQSEEVTQIPCEEHQRKGSTEQEAYSSDNNVTDQEEDEDKDDDREDKPCLKPTLRPVTTVPSISSASGNGTPLTPESESPHCINTLQENSSYEAPPTEENRPKIGLSLKLGAAGSPKMPQAVRRKALAAVDSVFNKFADEEAEETPKKRKLVPLDYSEDEKGGLSLDGTEVTGSRPGVNTEEKRKHIKSLIEKIPTVKQELFNYQLDWNMVDTTLMDRRIRPWINKKIIEYIGEEEATLVEFVCSKIMAHSTPEGILDDVAMVLDEEAEVFIVKMWRLLIYETESKKIGLVK